MISLIFLVYALAHVALFAWALVLFMRDPRPGTVPLLIVTFALVYDNGVLAAGRIIGQGALLEHLSVARFFLHAFGTPLLALTALALMRRCGPGWAQTGAMAAALVVLTLAMIGIGVDAELIHLDLQPRLAASLVSYGNAAAQGPPIAPTVTVLVLMAAGALLWWRLRDPWLLLGSVAEFVAAAVGNALFVIGNLGELVLLATLILADGRTRRLTRAASSRTAAPS